MNQLVTRWPGGFTNAAPGSTLGDLKVPRPMTYFQQFNDFTGAFVPSDWIVTGAGTVALLPGTPLGIVTLVNSAALNDETSFQWAGNTGAFLGLYNAAPTKDLIFATRVAIDDALNGSFLVGLCSVDTTPMASLPASGMFVYKPPASLFPQGFMRQANVGTNIAQTQTPMVNNTYVDISIQYIAAEGVCRMFVGDAAFRLPAPLTLATAALAPTFGVRNGTAAARTLSADWWFAGRER